MTSPDGNYRLFVVWVAGQEELQTPPGFTPNRSTVFATDSAAAIQMCAQRWGVNAATLRASIV